MTFSVRPIVADDWREYREIRLRMLADTPIAYGETLATASALSDDEWMHRTERIRGDDGIGLVAIDDDGRWLGVMRGHLSRVSGPMLIGVFVDAAARGRHSGVADALLDEIIAWAGAHGSTLTLHVHADNPRAIAFYERRGFRRTGETVEYELPPYGLENEMRLKLGGR